MQLHLLSFGGPSVNYHEALTRLRAQAETMNVFSSIHTYTDKDLLHDPEFMHKDFVQHNSRGFGYWIWKAYYIQKTLHTIPDGDLLMYLDAGCELNPQGKHRLFDLVPVVLRKKIIGTHSISNDITYTKRATINAICPDMNDNLLRKNHMQAGYLWMVNCAEIRNLISDWNKWNSCVDLIDDSIGMHEHPTFIEHRHDQSVFNLLVKMRGLHNYDAEPADVQPQNPVWYCRNRSKDTTYMIT